jgi:hypothetical protein
MADKKRKHRWIVRGFGALFIILLILVLLLPRLVNLEPVKQKILAEASKEIGGQVKCDRISLSLLPLPHVVIYNGSLAIPGKVSGTVGSLSVHPRILPLFTFKVQLAEVKVQAPEFDLILQEAPKKEEKKAQDLSPEVLGEEVWSVLTSVAKEVPGLLVQVEDARLNILKGNKSIADLQIADLQIGIPSNQMKIALADFTFTIDKLKGSQGEVRSSTVNKTSNEANKKLAIKGRTLKTAVAIDEEKTTISLSLLDLTYPELNMTGTFVMHQTAPLVRLELVGSSVDINSTREVALALAADDPTVRDIFDILRGGKVPLIKFSSQGNLLAELDDSENMLIEAGLVEGKVHVPDVDLDLEEVKGDAIISKGMLIGKDLEAKLGNTRARHGEMKLGLEGDDAPFHLDILVDADLAQLPPILKRLVEDRDFKREIELIDKLEGKATGRLVLGETLASVNVRVDVTEFNFSAKYKRVPYPLEIDGGRFFLEGTQIDVDKVNIKAGQSFFSELTGKFGWEKIPYIEIESAKTELSLGETYQWVKSLRELPPEIANIKSLEGVLVLSAMRLKGPLLTPAKWIYESKGEVRKLALNTALLPGPVKMTRAEFKTIETATEQKFSFSAARIAMLDGSLRVSGVLYDYFRGLNKVDLTLQGNMGEKTTRWVSKLIHLPPKISLRPPLSFSKAHLVWEEGLKTSFAGDLVVHNGPKVALDVLKKPGELTIKKLLIEHKNSRASTQFSLKKNDLSIGFKGKLTERTMRELHEGYYDLPGMLEGDFSARISLDKPALSTAQGRITGHNLIVPWDFEMPLEIKSLSLDARDNHLRLKSTRLTLGDNHLVLAGDMNFSAAGLLFNMDLTTDSLDWNNIEKIIEPEFAEDENKNKNRRELPIRGTLRLTSNIFKYDKFAWEPLHANIFFGRYSIDVMVTEANLCNISTPGVLEITPEEIALDFRLVSNNQDLDAALDCLLDKKGFIIGSFDLKGKVTARGKSEDVIESAQANVEFQAHDGRIYHDQEFGVLSTTFARLSITDLFRGKVPDLKTEGFPYRSIIIKANVEDGKLILEEALIDGEGMQIACLGDIDLAKKEVDVEILAAPFRTVDSVVKRTPIFGRILGGTLVSVPVRVTGDWADPEVRTMPASSVGAGLLGIMKRAVAIPVEIVQPSAPDEK